MQELEQKIESQNALIVDLQSKLRESLSRLDKVEYDHRTHTHDGLNSLNVNDRDIIPGYRSGGNITMSTLGRVYKIGVTNKPKSILFYGVASNIASNQRSLVMGSAHLGPSYYFQPDTTSTVKPGGPVQRFYQSSVCFTIASNEASSSSTKAISGEGHIINVILSSGSDIVARATVTDFTNTDISITLVTLSSGWSISGNFVVS